MARLHLVVAAVVLACAVSQAFACESAMSLIEQAEGLRLCEYVDTTGHRTVCYGFNLDAYGAAQKVEAVGGNFNNVYNGGCLNQTQCADLLYMEVKVASQGEQAVFGSQCSCIAAVLTDMTYNLGEAGISTFNTFIGYIKEHNWSAAAQDVRGTLWCRQVGNRCTRDSGIIANGC